METYIIRVNGVTYEVEVEKKTEAGQQAQGTFVQQTQSQPQAAVTAAAPAPAATAPAAQAGQPVTSGTAGKIWKVEAKVGDTVKKGDTIVVLEAMKMEIPVVAPADGKIVSLPLSEGDSVEAGQTVAAIA